MILKLTLLTPELLLLAVKLETTHKPAKYQTNYLIISQKPNRYFPEYIFYEPQHFPCPSRAKREIDAFF